MSITSTNEFQSRKMNFDRSTLTNPIYWWKRKIIIHDNLFYYLFYYSKIVVTWSYFTILFMFVIKWLLVSPIKNYQYLQIILGPYFMTLALWRIIVASDWIDFYGTLNNDAIFVVLFDYFWKICLTYLHVNIVRR